MKNEKINKQLETVKQILQEKIQTYPKRTDDLKKKLYRALETINHIREEILDERDHYLKIIENMQDVYYRADMEGKLIFASPSMETLLGYDQASLYGTDIAEKFYKYPEQRNYLINELNKNGEVKNYEVTLLDNNNNEIQILTSSHFIYNKKGDAIGIEGTITDITERKKAEISLRESEEKYRSVVENSHTGICIMKDEFQIIYTNPKFTEITGYPKDEINGTDFRKLLFEEQMDSFTHRYPWDFLIHSKLSNTEIQARHKNRRKITLGIRTSPIKTYSGEVQIVVQILDITQQKAAQKELEEKEKKLRESEKKYRTLTNQLPVGVYRTTPEGYFMYFNKTLAQMLEFKEEELANTKVPDIYVNKEDRKTEIEEVLANPKKIIQKELSLKTKTGKTILVKDNINALQDVDGNIIYFDGVLEDITEKKKMEKALIESESKFRRLAQTTSTAIMVYQGDKWVYANPAAERISGYTEDELKKMNYWDFVAPEHQNMIKKRGKKRQKREQISSGYEFKIIHKSGTPKWVYLEGSVMEFKRKPAGLISVIDITRIKNTEQELRDKNFELQAAEEELRATNNALKEMNTKLEEQTEDLKRAKEKAEESDRLKSAFLANMSHEIRTPINGIVGFTQLLKDEEYSQEEKEEFYDLIDSNSRQLLQIINDIIDISKIEANQLNINKSIFSINKLMDELYEFTQYELDSFNKTIELYTEKKLPNHQANIKTDKVRVKQILTNLLNNAIKFTEQGEIHFGYSFSGEDHITLYVSDTGIGIPEDKQHFIFDHFRRAHETKSTKFGGTGLGLSITKKLVDLLRGTITMESSEGKGTTFKVSLPVEKITDQYDYRDKIQQAHCNWTGKKILVIEDDPSSQKFITEALKTTGASLILCKNGQEGFKTFQQTNNLALILMDIKLPDEDGLSITRKIRRINNQLPIIATTAYAMSKDKKTAINAGCNDYISKPIHKQTLINHISHHING